MLIDADRASRGGERRQPARIAAVPWLAKRGHPVRAYQVQRRVGVT